MLKEVKRNFFCWRREEARVRSVVVDGREEERGALVGRKMSLRKRGDKDRRN
ncbi:unnamed protein product [Meloidogyne enterolobii]|uniref:Uncharacterized protein n=1 Tax=Meloidogyne enterolobii TaxID=390850 RepID=A0ACB0XKB3_MELEN